MNQREAKKVMYRITAGLVQRWLDSDWGYDDDIPEQDNKRLERAACDLIEEMDKKSGGESFRWPEWWKGARV
jgi:hypothetical protein